MTIIDFVKGYLVADKRTTVFFEWFWMNERVVDEEYSFEGRPSDFVEKKCTRATEWGNCYDSKGMYVCLYIKAVEEYTVTNMLQICRYDKVTTCPSGTTAG